MTRVGGSIAVSLSIAVRRVQAPFILRLLLAVVGLPSIAMRAEQRPEAARLIIVANAADEDSVALARFYADKRGVPVGNIISIPMPLEETITWRAFIGQVFEPLQDELVNRAWIDAVPMALRDRLGRRRYSVAGHHITYLVVCRGVPLRIQHDPALVDEVSARDVGRLFRTNQAAVDSELALLAQSGGETLGFVRNPLFSNEHPAPLQAQFVVKVTRLDGPTPDDARHLVVAALNAERCGVAGRAYFDLKGPHPQGDAWLVAARRMLEGMGFETETEVTGATFDGDARFDAPVWYAGWYAPDANGPFLAPGFRFPPGAVAIHIHSASAATLRSDSAGWCGPFVASGVTATVGNVYEPYLQLSHRPDLLIQALTEGKAFGDAAYFSLPVLGWQSLAIGDPLFRPFAVPVEVQRKDLDALPVKLRGYVVLRQAHLLERGGKSGEALDLMQRSFDEDPDMPLALTLAVTLERVGRSADAARVLERAAPRAAVSGQRWLLAREVARGLARLQSARAAADLYALLSQGGAPSQAAQTALLQEAHGPMRAGGSGSSRQ